MEQFIYFGFGFLTGVLTYLGTETLRKEELEEVEDNEPKIRNGSLVYFDFEILHPFLTKGKKYKALNVYVGDTSISFNIIDDNGRMCFCLLEGCGYLGGNDWKIYKY